MASSESKFSLPSKRTTVGGVVTGSTDAMNRTSVSSRDGMRTARETALQAVWPAAGSQSSRRFGCTSTPVKSLCSSLVPRVRNQRPGLSAISSCTNPVTRWVVRAGGSRVTGKVPEMVSALSR